MAYTWVPVPDSINALLSAPREEVDISAARPVIERILSGAQPDLPKKLKDFPALRSNGRWLSRTVAAELGFPLGSASGNYSFSTYLQQLATWVDVPNENGTAVVRYGIAARYVVTADEIRVGAKLNSIAGLAASATYETVRASAEFSALGVPSAWLIGQIPTGGTFDMNKYVEFEGALRGMQRVLEERVDEELLPQVLEVRADVPQMVDENFEEALAVGWALSCIARRLRLGNAQSDYDRGTSRFRSVVEAVYAKVAKVTTPTDQPGKSAARDAERLLNGLKVEED